MVTLFLLLTILFLVITLIIFPSFEISSWIAPKPTSLIGFISHINPQLNTFPNAFLSDSYKITPSSNTSHFSHLLGNLTTHDDPSTILGSIYDPTFPAPDINPFQIGPFTPSFAFPFTDPITQQSFIWVFTPNEYLSLFGIQPISSYPSSAFSSLNATLPLQNLIIIFILSYRYFRSISIYYFSPLNNKPFLPRIPLIIFIINMFCFYTLPY